MNVFEFDPSSMSWEEFSEQQRLRRQYIREAPDPNETGEDGRTLLTLAMSFCSDPEGREIISGLLDRGADPNKPTPFANFFMLVIRANSTDLFQKLIEKGMRLNDLYEANEVFDMTDNVFTILDYLYSVRGYISPRRKRLNQLAEKHGSGLGERRKLVEDLIALLESHGAKRSADIVEK